MADYVVGSAATIESSPVSLHNVSMATITITQFGSNLSQYISDVFNNRHPLKITDDNGSNVVIVREDDWERQQKAFDLLQTQQEDMIDMMHDLRGTWPDDDGELKPEVREQLIAQSRQLQEGTLKTVPLVDVIAQFG